MFQEQRRCERDPVFQVIAEDFPAIADYMRTVKEHGHEALAHELQRNESALMIERVGEVLRSDYPDTPATPIHDALMVPNSFAEAARDIIASQFRRLGLKPTVKIGNE